LAYYLALRLVGTNPDPVAESSGMVHKTTFYLSVTWPPDQDSPLEFRRFLHFPSSGVNFLFSSTQILLLWSFSFLS